MIKGKVEAIHTASQADTFQEQLVKSWGFEEEEVVEDWQTRIIGEF